MEFDVIIKNGTIIDGTGRPAYISDIGIQGEHIVAIGELGDCSAENEINARNNIVSPGFIDPHSHSDTSLLVDPRGESMIRQGVTSQVIGNCGFSPAPISDDKKKQLSEIFAFINYVDQWPWNSFEEFLNIIAEKSIVYNVIPLVGHSTIRAEVMGYESREADKKEIASMCELLKQTLDEGAWGMSTGLMTPPGMSADEKELDALNLILARNDRLHATHMRNYAADILSAMDESMQSAEKSGTRLLISHLRLSKINRHLMPDVLSMLYQARKNLDVTYDIYPYDAGSANLSQILPGWAQANGVKEMKNRLKDPGLYKKIKEELIQGRVQSTSEEEYWENIMIIDVSSPSLKDIEGMNITEIAQNYSKSPTDVVLDLIAEAGNELRMISFSNNEEDVQTMMTQDLAIIMTDGAAFNPKDFGKSHPRYYGTYPKILGRWVRQDRLFDLETVIKKMTFLPANIIGLKDRGALKEDYYADIVIFDPESIIDRATFTDPQQFPEGIKYVLVNGEITIREGEHTGKLKGKVLKD